MNGLLERLTTPLDPDAFLEILGPLHTRRCQGVVASVTPLTPESAELVLDVGRSWPGHIAGQFVTLGVDINGVRHTRCYSLTSPPVSGGARGRSQISIAVRAKPDGFVSQHLVHSVKPGTVVQLGPPEGDFTLTSAATRRVLLVTGGSGITPVMGMVRSHAVSSTHRPFDITVIHHAPTPHDAMFGDELEARAEATPWLNTYVRTTRQPKGEHLSEASLDELCPDWAERDVFVCGPAALIDTVTELWANVGASERVHVERFGPAPTSCDTPDAGAGGTATFAASGREVAAPGDTPLLVVAEDAGLVPEAGCRMGICRTCTTQLVAGSVTDLRNGRRSEAGSHVQVCVSAANGDVTLDL